MILYKVSMSGFVNSTRPTVFNDNLSIRNDIIRMQSYERSVATTHGYQQFCVGSTYFHVCLLSNSVGDQSQKGYTDGKKQNPGL